MESDYIVVLDVDNDKDAYHCACIREADYTLSKHWWCKRGEIVEYIRGYSLKPLNFSVDCKNTIKEDCGSFSRFSKMGSAVVLAEIKAKNGVTKGYRVISCKSGAIVNLKISDVLSQESKYRDNNQHFLQNAVVRNGRGIACYPLHPFPVMEMSVSPNKKRQKLSNKVGNGRGSRGVGTQQPFKPENIKNFAEIEKSLSPKQKKEFAMCRAKGVDPKLISDPNLSSQQMRVLWVSKSKGALSEYFNKPEFSSDAMKFYADRLFDKENVADCKELLKHPELKTDELGELYECICDGVDCTDLIGKSATDIGVERERQTSKYWDTSRLIDDDYFMKASNVVAKIKEY